MEPIKVLVAYNSVTGNVEAMARAVAAGCTAHGAMVDLRHVDAVDLDAVPAYDAFAFGSPTHCGTMSAKMNAFFNERLHPRFWGKLPYRVGVAFTSSGGLGGGNEMALWALLSAILNFGMVTFGVPDYVANRVTLHYGAVAIKTPDADAVRSCQRLGQRLVEHAGVLRRGQR
jgi:NAD(P)H dehydrogenase (quinone)